MPEVEPTDQRGHITTGNDRNGLDLETTYVIDISVMKTDSYAMVAVKNTNSKL